MAPTTDPILFAHCFHALHNSDCQPSHISAARLSRTQRLKHESRVHIGRLRSPHRAVQNRHLLRVSACSAAASRPVRHLATATMGRSTKEETPCHFITVHGRTLRYCLGGEGPNVILLHGASGCLEDWTFQHFDELCKNYRVLAFDRPGLGHSEPARERASLSAQASLMRDAASALGVTSAVLVGHSYGGAVALAWALDAPAQVTGFVLISAVSRPFELESNWLYELMCVPGLGWLASQFVPLFANRSYVSRSVAAIFAPQRPPDGYLEHVVSPRSMCPPVFRCNAAQVRELAREMARRKDTAASLMMPIELIHGVEDNIVCAEQHAMSFANTIPGVKMTLLEKIGHMPHHITPDELYAALERIIYV